MSRPFRVYSMTRNEFHTKLMAARDLPSDEHEGVFLSVREQLRGLDDTQQFEILFPVAIKSQHHAPSCPASELLRQLSPACPLSCEDAVRALLSEWDVSIEEVPFYIAARFGVARVRQAIESLSSEVEGHDEKQRLKTVAYWIDKYVEAFSRLLTAKMTTAVSYRVQFYQGLCNHCRRTFAMPLLGDQSYGQFILFGEKGSVCGYLCAFTEPAWEDITQRLRQAGLFPDSEHRDIPRFQDVIAASADAIQGQKLSMLPVCPSCSSDSVTWWDSKPLATREIPVVTFNEYRSLLDSQKNEKLAELWRQCRIATC